MEVGSEPRGLEIIQQPPSNWYKDQNGKNGTFEMKLKMVGKGCTHCKAANYVSVQLLYENGKKVDNQNLLNLKSGMFLNKQNETTLSLRIMEVSKNHRNQRFRVQAHLPICVNVSDNLKSTIASNPILVLSKKNKRPLKSHEEAMERKKYKTSPEQPSMQAEINTKKVQDKIEIPVGSVDNIHIMDTISIKSMDLSTSHPFCPENGDEEIIRFSKPDATVCLWANAAYSLLQKLQFGYNMTGSNDSKRFKCPSCHETFDTAPAHSADCDLDLLLQKQDDNENIQPSNLSSTYTSKSYTPCDNYKNNPNQSLKNEFISTYSFSKSVNTFHLEGESGYSMKHGISKTSSQFSATVHPTSNLNSMDLNKINLNLHSWQEYSSLHKLVFSMDAGMISAQVPSSSKPLPSLHSLVLDSHAYPAMNSTLPDSMSSLSMSNFSKGLSKLESFSTEKSSSGISSLLNYSKPLEGISNSLSKNVHLSELLLSSGKKEFDSFSVDLNSISMLLNDESFSHTREEDVHTIIAEDFMYCGCPALDINGSLLGFYCLNQESKTENVTFDKVNENISLRFIPTLSPLSEEMITEMTENIEKWSKQEPCIVFKREYAEADLDLIKMDIVASLLKRNVICITLKKMGKHDFLTPKAIANRMKAKGLQKLRWFCQVCQKQCRDENGFKCHTQSESHQRQMLIVASNPDKFMGGYSEMFEKAFLENLRRRHGTKRMRANVVYNEYIQDKLHIHMNATQWTTLSGFVQYLGRTGKCVVDETEKGWYIQYIDRDPRTLLRQEELEKKRRADKDHEERNRAFIQRQLEIAKEGTNDELVEQRPTKLLRTEKDAKISLSLPSKPIKAVSSGSTKKEPVALNNVFESIHRFVSSDSNNHGGDSGSYKRKSAMDTIMEQEERTKQSRRDEEEKSSRQENWITKGIVVKIVNKKLADGRYYKMKGVITKVDDKFCATVETLDSRDVLKLDQDDLETVIPKEGRRVKIVNGIGRGSIAILLSISVDDYCASVRIDNGSRRGETLHKVEYEDICKIADDV